MGPKQRISTLYRSSKYRSFSIGIRKKKTQTHLVIECFTAEFSYLIRIRKERRARRYECGDCCRQLLAGLTKVSSSLKPHLEHNSIPNGKLDHLLYLWPPGLRTKDNVWILHRHKGRSLLTSIFGGHLWDGDVEAVKELEGSDMPDILWSVSGTLFQYYHPQRHRYRSGDLALWLQSAKRLNWW